ncbi:MAG: hypothetical protein F6K30_08530 [Cyanothece sp. SIO2G6]|nr:hypothetical protein [Cyanothece sp. SIO2G6]
MRDTKLDMGALGERSFFCVMQDTLSEEDLNVIVRAVYTQVLGNTYVMESERLVIPESQLKNGQITVREFVRAVAQSSLYRDRFFTNCSHNRFIELNFKHLLGRSPQGNDDFAFHGRLLTEEGYTAEIDSYIDSIEYWSAFGEHIVPYYRYQTRNGQGISGFTDIVGRLIRTSGSDRSLIEGDVPRSMQSTKLYNSYEVAEANSPRVIAERALRQGSRSLVSASGSYRQKLEKEAALKVKIQEQENRIKQLKVRLAEIKPWSTWYVETDVMAAPSVQKVATQSSGPAAVAAIVDMFSQQETKDIVQSFEEIVTAQSTEIEELEQQISAARPWSNVIEYRLNKWRGRSF